ncbi:MAG: uroporphyrinogen-III C-methyltransferase [Acidimicrobiia bacterium]
MTVYLVGAGPGDPELITVKGARLLGDADVVVYDRLVNPALLDLVRPDAERIDVGKQPGSPLAQEHINAVLVDLGRRHPTVVRLKGGDPFVFGRGGEEAIALAAEEIAFEVVPGISSSVAVPAYAGVPITHRGLAASFTVVTGHRRIGDEQATNWEALARVGGTVVVLMGVKQRASIASRLIEGGLADSTPVVVIESGTGTRQRTLRTTLATLGDADVHSPAVIVIGSVADLDLAWFTPDGDRA